MWVSCCWELLCKAVDDELLVGRELLWEAAVEELLRGTDGGAVVGKLLLGAAVRMMSRIL